MSLGKVTLEQNTENEGTTGEEQYWENNTNILKWNPRVAS